jgi:tight adherence protein C
MFFTWFDYVGMAILSILLLVSLILYKEGNRYAEMFAALDEKEYPLKDLYGMGYAALEKSKCEFKARWNKKIRADLEVLYTEKYTEYYLRVLYAQIITLDLMVLLGGTALIVLSGEVSILLVIVMMVIAITYYYATYPHQKIARRSEELIMDYAEVVSNLALLTNAGMILREAWEEVAFSNNGVFYKEMQKVVEDLNNGIGESDAFHEFGVRCVIPEAKKFASTIIQGIQKGNSQLSKDLQAQSTEVWEQKKQIVMRKGEKAANRLMFPVFLMFGGILIMILIPIFANLF